jgi:hypothetical protein
MDRCWLQGSLGDALHSISCAAGYNVRWLMRAIVRLGISPAFLRLLQAALSQLSQWQTHYGPARRIETGPKVDMKSWLKKPKTLTSVNY